MDIAVPFWPRARRVWQQSRNRDEARRAAPQPARRAPVFIHDVATPWRGETLLLALLRAQAELDRDQS
ncbi:hypothetical protein ACFMPD_00290 [Sedimentitalea sp. HM32M-2]|uniref:hypothetical protein n=1 Tax=Sedimentitalea sp. HM32M-2 TaxID=3351566 RepID=UPI0036292C49